MMKDEHEDEDFILPSNKNLSPHYSPGRNPHHDLRFEALQRAQQRDIDNRNKIMRDEAQRIASKRAADSLARKRRETLQLNAADTSKNTTPIEAKLAEIDYKFNGARARALSGEFIPPRWVPDEEVDECILCNSLFDWVNRRHHCRNCGKVVCGPCSNYKDLLPYEFGENDPQRVCQACHLELVPKQSSLTLTIANHQRANHIDATKCVRRHLNLPFSMTLGSEIRKAAYSLYNLFETENIIQDRAIPLRLLSRARGVAFLTVIKAGFGFGGRIGTGLVISKLPSGDWSAPSAIGVAGISWGALIGADITDYVIFLNTIDAVRAFAGLGQLSIGAGIDVAIGPVGRSGGADMNIGSYGMAHAISYAHCRGLYAGISLDGSIILSRSDLNHRFYGQRYSPVQIIGGDVPRPRAAQPIYDALHSVLSTAPSPKYKAQVDLQNEIPVKGNMVSNLPDSAPEMSGENR